MTSDQRGHYSYLLRLWRAGNGDTPEWRITIEDVRTRERHSFASAAQLAAFLDGQIHRDTKGRSAALAPREMTTSRLISKRR